MATQLQALEKCLRETLSVQWVSEPMTATSPDSCSIRVKHLNYDGMNILHLAIKFSTRPAECVGSLLRFLKDNNLAREIVNGQTRVTKQTPLHLAVHYGNIEIVRLLLKHGADPTIKNCWDEIPLHVAESPCIVTQLLDNK